MSSHHIYDINLRRPNVGDALDQSSSHHVVKERLYVEYVSSGATGVHT